MDNGVRLYNFSEISEKETTKKANTLVTDHPTCGRRKKDAKTRENFTTAAAAHREKRDWDMGVGERRAAF